MGAQLSACVAPREHHPRSGRGLLPPPPAANLYRFDRNKTPFPPQSAAFGQQLQPLDAAGGGSGSSGRSGGGGAAAGQLPPSAAPLQQQQAQAQQQAQQQQAQPASPDEDRDASPQPEESLLELLTSTQKGAPPRPGTGFRWTRGQLLGQGSFGTVYQALNQATGEIMAVKQVHIPCRGACVFISRVCSHRLLV